MACNCSDVQACSRAYSELKAEFEHLLDCMAAARNLSFPACMMDDPSTTNEAILQSCMSDIAYALQGPLVKHRPRRLDAREEDT